MIMYSSYMRRLQQDLTTRYNYLMRALPAGDEERINVDAYNVRLAHRDINCILAEIKRLG